MVSVLPDMSSDPTVMVWPPDCRLALELGPDIGRRDIGKGRRGGGEQGKRR